MTILSLRSMSKSPFLTAVREERLKPNEIPEIRVMKADASSARGVCSLSLGPPGCCSRQ